MEKINIKNIAFDEFSFLIREKKDIKDEGKAQVHFSFNESGLETELNEVVVELNLNYEEKYYEASAKMRGIFGLDKSEFPEGIPDTTDFRLLFIHPIVDKFKVHVGMVSDGINGSVQIPSINFESEEEKDI